MSLKVLVYPQDDNPYQGLLYSHMHQPVTCTYLVGPTSSQTINNLILPFQLFYYRVVGYKIFHLHWVYSLIFPGKNYLSRFISTVYYYFILTLIKLLGFQIVWTVHNVLPHNATFLNDLHARKYLAWLANAKIVHSEATIDDLNTKKIDTTNCHVIPIGSFVGIYPNTVTKSLARKKLNLSQHDFIFLFFGRIEPYKGTLNLIKSFLKLKTPAHLIIAGKCSDPQLQSEINKFRNHSKISLVDSYIPDDAIQLYMNAADITVYPFERITTSSSVLLSLSFAKPIIYPLVGNLSQLPTGLGFSYDLSDQLLTTLESAVTNKSQLAKIGKNCLDYASSLSWDKISQQTLDLYLSLI